MTRRPVPTGWIVQTPRNGLWVASNVWFPGEPLVAKTYDDVLDMIDALEATQKRVPEERPDPAGWDVRRFAMGWEGVSRRHRTPVSTGVDAPARAVRYTGRDRGDVLDAIAAFERELGVELCVTCGGVA